MDLFLADIQARQTLESPYVIIKWLYSSIFFQDSAFRDTYRFSLYSKANQKLGAFVN